MNDSHNVYNRDPLVTIGLNAALGMMNTKAFHMHAAEIAALDRAYKMHANRPEKLVRLLRPIRTQAGLHAAGELLHILATDADRLAEAGVVEITN